MSAPSLLPTTRLPYVFRRPVQVAVEVVVRLDFREVFFELVMLVRGRGDVYTAPIGPEEFSQALTRCVVVVEEIVDMPAFRVLFLRRTICEPIRHVVCIHRTGICTVDCTSFLSFSSYLRRGDCATTRGQSLIFHITDRWLFIPEALALSPSPRQRLKAN